MSKMTHRGDLIGCDSRTRPDYRETILLRETKLFWADQYDWYGSKYRKSDGRQAGRSDYPMYRLDLDSIVPLEDSDAE